jgi:hypothetical protein
MKPSRNFSVRVEWQNQILENYCHGGEALLIDKFTEPTKSQHQLTGLSLGQLIHSNILL